MPARSPSSPTRGRRRRGGGAWRRVASLIAAAVLSGCSDFGSPVFLPSRCEPDVQDLDFGTVPVGSVIERRIRFRNHGPGSAGGDIRIVCSAAAPFTIASGSGPFRLAAGESTTVVVAFMPADTGSFTCTVDAGSDCPAVPIRGTAFLPPPAIACAVAPSVLDFGDVEVGSGAVAEFKLRNEGTDPFDADVPSGCGPFTVIGGDGLRRIDPGDSLVVTVLFEPVAAGIAACGLDTGAACGSVSLTGNGVAPAPPVAKYGADVQPIFNIYCVSCHGLGGNGGLDLRSGVSYGNLVNRTSLSYAPAVRVKPFDPAGSVLYGKVTDSGAYGGGMPPGFPIPLSERNKILSWIEAGAPNN
jgi:hypothetical protein